MSDQRGFQYFGKTPAGVEMALQLDVDAGMSPKNLAAYLKAVDAELRAAGFTRSDRLDKPAGGWGGKGQQPRPETPPPAGIVRPSHCEAPMRYVKYRKEGAPGAPARNLDPGWKDMWVCSKDKQCEDLTSGKSDKAAANFQMHAEPRQEHADASEEARPAQPATNGNGHSPAPATAAQLSAFWTAVGARGLGYSADQVAAMNGAQLTPRVTKAELDVLFKKLKDAAAGVAAA